MEKLTTGIMVAVVFFGIALIALLLSMGAEHLFGDIRVATILMTGAISIGVVGVIIAVLLIFSKTVNSNAEAFMRKDHGNTFIFDLNNRELRQIDPYSPSQRELPRGQETVDQISNADIQKIVEAVRRSQRYMPLSSEESNKEIDLW